MGLVLDGKQESETALTSTPVRFAFVELVAGLDRFLRQQHQC